MYQIIPIDIASHLGQVRALGIDCLIQRATRHQTSQDLAVAANGVVESFRCRAAVTIVHLIVHVWFEERNRRQLELDFG